MSVAYAPQAAEDLLSIWLSNRDHYGISHADAYIAFLRAGIAEIPPSVSADREVPGRPGLQYRLLRRRRRGHGHVVVYQPQPDGIRVLHVFHTAQDWQCLRR